MQINCTKCGKESPVASMFCGSCGAALDSARIGLEQALRNVDAHLDSQSTVELDALVLSPSNSIAFRANTRVVAEKRCPVCNGSFALAEEAVRCDRCTAVLHTACWKKNQGCTEPACRGDVKPCPKCGKLINKKAVKCKFCSAYLEESIRKPDVGPRVMAEGAVSSVVVGIIGLAFFGFILGWVAISRGRKALNLIEEGPERYHGKPLAIAGIILGGVDIVGWIVVILSRFQ